jgi:predicted metal-binding membrane protein
VTVVLMMVAMMTPGALPATISHVRVAGGPRTAPLFVGTYLGIWALVGLAVYALYRQPSPAVAGTIVIAAGVYELTPIKQRFRQRCQAAVHSGLDFGLCCLGSSIGLMAVLVAINMMSIPWMAAIAAVVVAQKMFRKRTAVDVALGLAIVAVGVLVVIDPSSVPALNNQSM